MARFQEMRVLLAVTEAESFAGGAKLLGISPPSVTRAIAALEARLGTLLLIGATQPLGHWLRREMVIKWMDRSTGLIFVLFAARLALSRR